MEIGGRKVNIIVRKPPPATFTINNLMINSSSVNVGETITISVKVSNTGRQSGSYAITMKIFARAINVMFIRHGISLALSHSLLIKNFVNSFINDQQTPVTPEECRETVIVMNNFINRLYKKYGNSK